MESDQPNRADFLVEYRAATEPLERYFDYTDRAATEFVSIAIRYCYLLNAGGLVAIPAIIELLPGTEYDRSIMIWPAGLFTVGILLAAVTNYLAYFVTIQSGEGLTNEHQVRSWTIHETFYRPHDETIIRKKIEEHSTIRDKSYKKVSRYTYLGIIIFTITIACFLAGVFSAICGMMQL